MQLIDLNQIMLSNMMAQIGNHTNIEINTNLFRHMCLNTLRNINMKFKKQYGEMVICCDDKNYWRKSVFPYYKANRKKFRDSSELNWTAIFESLNLIRQELKDYFPYRVIQIDHAEADDIIATLCQKHGNTNEAIVIVSGDKDFQQLQQYSNVVQYDPVRKRWIECDEPEVFLVDHIIKGDVGDGIPNILSSDDVFVTDARQKPLTAKRIDEIIPQIESNKFVNESLKRNFIRNKMLIDLTEIPEEIYNKVIERYTEQGDKDRSKLFNYFVQNKLKNMLDSISDF